MWNHSLRKHNSHLGNNNISFTLPTLTGTWIYLMLQLQRSPCNVFLSITLPLTYDPSYRSSTQHAPNTHRQNAHLWETFLRRKCWRVPLGKCQPRSPCGSFGSIQGDCGWIVGVHSMLPIDLRIDHTAVSSRDCSALHMHCLLLLGEEGNVWSLQTLSSNQNTICCDSLQRKIHHV